jgi:hypothetical protein
MWQGFALLFFCIGILCEKEIKYEWDKRKEEGYLGLKT